MSAPTGISYAQAAIVNSYNYMPQLVEEAERGESRGGQVAGQVVEERSQRSRRGRITSSKLISNQRPSTGTAKTNKMMK